MSAAFHRGVTQELRKRLQTAGIRVEEGDAQKAIAGATVARPGSPAQDTVTEIASEVWRLRFPLMHDWENDHPGESPFPPIFAQVVLDKLRADMNEDDWRDTVVELIKLAEAELEL
jgi:hypothetical protein